MPQALHVCGNRSIDAKHSNYLGDRQPVEFDHPATLESAHYQHLKLFCSFFLRLTNGTGRGGRAPIPQVCRVAAGALLFLTSSVPRFPVV